MHSQQSTVEEQPHLLESWRRTHIVPTGVSFSVAVLEIFGLNFWVKIVDTKSKLCSTYITHHNYTPALSSVQAQQYVVYALQWECVC